MLVNVAENHLKVRAELIKGKYDWYRPIYNINHITHDMVKANRDLQEIKDNGAIDRGVTTKSFKKEGKIRLILK